MNPLSDFNSAASGLPYGSPAGMPSSAAPERDCIIIADDAEMSLAIMRRILSPHFDILEARTGTEVVQLLRAPPRPIAAILLDVMMPIMNGLQVLDFMQKNGLLGIIPVITVTALSDTQSKIQCFEAGAVDVLDKPLDREYLAFKLRWDIDHFRHLHALSSHPVAHAQVEQLEAILSALPAAIFVEDPATGTLLHCNRHFLNFNGVPEKPIGQLLESFPIAPDMLSAIRTAREAILIDNISKPALFNGSEPGSVYSILYRTFTNPVSNVTQLVGFITNVSYEVQDHNALENRIHELEGQIPT
jgi:CheY-like chemotaxis protein